MLSTKPKSIYRRKKRSPLFKFFEEEKNNQYVYKCKLCSCDHFEIIFPPKKNPDIYLFGYLKENEIKNYQYYYYESRDFAWSTDYDDLNESKLCLDRLKSHIKSCHGISFEAKVSSTKMIQERNDETRKIETILFMINNNVSFNAISSSEFERLSNIHVSNEELRKLVFIVCFLFRINGLFIMK